jgi:predicted deacetylase
MEKMEDPSPHDPKQPIPFASWLHQKETEGHEIVLHGWEHLVPQHSANAKRGFRTWFYEKCYTSNEAEFLNLSYSEARKRMELGLQVFRQLGFRPQGFIPPAWLMNPDVERAARDLHFVYSNNISEVLDLRSNCRIPSRSCVWSTRAIWRRWVALGWNRWLYNRVRCVDPLRISLHPNDIAYPRLWNQIHRFVSDALLSRTPTTYVGWMADKSGS